jgi:hypothetical protein
MFAAGGATDDFLSIAWSFLTNITEGWTMILATVCLVALARPVPAVPPLVACALGGVVGAARSG